MGQLKWVDSEFENIQFGDKRLNKRFMSVMDKISKFPSSSVNASFSSWAEVKAAYRLFDNNKFSVDEVMNQHRQSSLVRVGNENFVLAIQDTTTLNYHDHKSKEGLGYILNKETNGSDGTKGIFLHNTYLVTPSGCPLGIFDQEIYIRKKEKRTGFWSKPVEDKETFRWIKSVESIKAYFPDHICPVIVADREADKFPIMSFIDLIEEKFLIRFCRNRVVGPRSARNFRGEYYHENDYIDSLIERNEVKGMIEIQVRDKKTKKEKLIEAEIKFGSFFMPATNQSRYHNKGLDGFNCSFIYLKEVPKKKEENELLEWKLFTNLSIDSLESAIEKIEWYKHRWKVETFHKILKSGCKIEDRRFLNMQRLGKAITIYSIVAWRLHWLTMMARDNPDISCDVIFSESEWKILFIKEYGKKKKPPKTAPKLKDVYIWMAKLGGFLNRNNDGPPGVTTIWLGWQQLQIMTSTFELLTYG